jgi:hypothetical protein
MDGENDGTYRTRTLRHSSFKTLDGFCYDFDFVCIYSLVILINNGVRQCIPFTPRKIYDIIEASNGNVFVNSEEYRS